MLADINDVNNCLLWFVENSEHIKAVIQPDSMEKNKFLQLILSQNTHCCIEQIITLDSDYSKVISMTSGHWSSFFLLCFIRKIIMFIIVGAT